MTIQYRISGDDYINFSIDHFYRTRSMKLMRAITQFGFPVIWILALLAVTRFAPAAAVIGIIGVLALVWILFSPKLLDRKLRESVRTRLGKGLADESIGTQTLTLSEDGLEVLCGGVTTGISYGEVKAFRFGRGLYSIFAEETKVILVPASAFEDEEKKQAFLRFLTEKTGMDAGKR